MIADMKNIGVKTGFVGFVDLLGFRAKVMALRDKVDWIALRRSVERVHNLFEHKPVDSLTRDEHSVMAKTVMAFSDCLVVTAPVDSTYAEIQGYFDALLGEITGIAMAQGQCVVSGIFVRGGVDFGEWHNDDDIFISPALVVAYELERAVGVPMIAVSDGLYAHFFEHPDRKNYSAEFDPIPDLFLKVGLPNDRVCWCIDYLPICLRSVDPKMTPDEREQYALANGHERHSIQENAFWRSSLEWARRHKAAILTGQASSSTPSVKLKYDWLSRYHDDAVVRVFSNPPSDVMMSSG